MRYLKLFNLVSWIAYGAVLGLLDWEDARAHHLFLGVVGVSGVLLAVSWMLSASQRVLSSCIVTSTVLVVTYLGWWVTTIANQYAADPGPGLWRSVQVQPQIWTSIVKVLLERGELLGAAVQAYWLVGMPLTQILVVLSYLQIRTALRRQQASTSTRTH